jgi:hypothetical protein
MSQSVYARQTLRSNAFGFDAVDWFMILGGVALGCLLIMLV